MRNFESPVRLTRPSGEGIGTGRLAFSRRRGISIEVLRPFDPKDLSFESAEYPALHGTIASCPYGRKVVVLDAFRSRIRPSPPESTLEKIVANAVLIGNAPFQDAAPRFRGLNIRLRDLESWLGKSGITGASSPSGDPQLSLRLPEPVAIAVNDAAISIGMGWHGRHGLHSASIREEAAIHISADGELDLHGLLGWTSRIRSFISLCVDRPTPFVEVSGYDLTDQKHTVLFVDSFPRPASPEPRLPHEMLLTMRDFEAEGLKQAIERWIALDESVPTFDAIYFGTTHRRGQYVNETLLWLMHCVALLANATSGSDSARRAADLRTSLDAGLSSEELGPREPVLRGMCQEALMGRAIEESLEKHAEILQDILPEDIPSFSQRILEARQDMLWGSGTSIPEAHRGRRLYLDSERVRTLVKACLLDRLGVPPEKVAVSLRRTSMFQHLASSNER